MSYESYNFKSSQTQRYIFSDGTEKAGDDVKTVPPDGKCVPPNAIVTLNLPTAQGSTYIQGKAKLYISPPNPDNVQQNDKLIWSKTAYNWNAAPVGGTYTFWTLNPPTNGYYIFGNKAIGELVEVAPGSILTEFMNFWSVVAA